jgi:CheY-like chemotaxis protein
LHAPHQNCIFHLVLSHCSPEDVKVLAVEDDPEYLEMLKDIVLSVGHSLVIARNGVEAIQALEGEKIDVILSDVGMPTMDGVELHKQVRLREQHKETPFIFLTGLPNIARVREACTSNHDMVLQKPVPVDTLIKIFSGSLK